MIMIKLEGKIQELKLHQQSEIKMLIDRFIEHNKLNPLHINHAIKCPHCHSRKYVKNGVTSGRQRFKCKSCDKTYSQATLTSVHKMQKVGQWTDFIYLMFSSKNPLTLKELAEKLSLSTKTVHVWKHKLLSSLNKMDSINLSGVVEMDEVFLPFNVKGRKGKEKKEDVLSLEKHCIEKRQLKEAYREIKSQ